MDTIICPSTPAPEAEKVKHSRDDHIYGRDSSGENKDASEASDELPGVWEEREARYRQIVEDQTDPVARFRPDGSLTFVNGAYCRFFNKTDEELIGKGFFDPMTDEQALELRSRMTLLTPGQSTFRCEHEITVAPAEFRWVNWTFQGIFDGERKLVEIQSVARDVTDRKRAEIALKKSEARYSNLIKAIPDGVVAYQPPRECYVRKRWVCPALWLVSRGSLGPIYQLCPPGGRAENSGRLAENIRRRKSAT